MDILWSFWAPMTSIPLHSLLKNLRTCLDCARSELRLLRWTFYIVQASPRSLYVCPPRLPLPNAVSSPNNRQGRRPSMSQNSSRKYTWAYPLYRWLPYYTRETFKSAARYSNQRERAHWYRASSRLDQVAMEDTPRFASTLLRRRSLPCAHLTVPTSDASQDWL